MERLRNTAQKYLLWYSLILFFLLNFTWFAAWFPPGLGTEGGNIPMKWNLQTIIFQALEYINPSRILSKSANYRNKNEPKYILPYKVGLVLLFNITVSFRGIFIIKIVQYVKYLQHSGILYYTFKFYDQSGIFVKCIKQVLAKKWFKKEKQNCICNV